MVKPPSTAVPLKARVLDYAQKHIGQIIFLDTMAQDMDEEPVRLRQSINWLVREGYPWTVETEGRAWAVHGVIRAGTPGARKEQETRPKPGTKLVFETIGQAKDGSLVLECEDGRLFKAVEL